MPEELKEAFSKHPKAREGFESLAPSYRRKYLMWIASAKRPETRKRRTREAVEKLKSGEKLGLR
ncbi:bacteriocin-protection protein [Candidatus Fermentibacteria bacterium]|nr:bacteriocin-protection protein [Candidatus Fermentibacteria bacterium]